MLPANQRVNPPPLPCLFVKVGGVAFQRTGMAALFRRLVLGGVIGALLVFCSLYREMPWETKLTTSIRAIFCFFST